MMAKIEDFFVRYIFFENVFLITTFTVTTVQLTGGCFQQNQSHLERRID